ncbi:violaxanthin de-epoxidase precursor [Ostreococcus tauri]|uniref:Violaxanthin de-epoxidase n=1 Tax=Ostreococcus tauri TaxID=70448 RepID=A0A1Y5I821_OSTTA|nr:violaxanthin de-epoxidase precursor [Ostreococcus tauri]
MSARARALGDGVVASRARVRCRQTNDGRRVGARAIGRRPSDGDETRAQVGGLDDVVRGVVSTLAAVAVAEREMQTTGACLLQNCGRELATCVTDEKCLEDLVCLQGCFGREDESDCQIRCGDLYASNAVGTFNTCAVTEKSCVAQRKDDGKYPVPPFDALADDFTIDTMVKEKRWYIVAGLNKDFDIFDCQEHFFDKGEDGKMYIKINWRVNRPNGQFYERSDVQRFYQDPDGKAILYNRGNVMLHYQDTWYIPAYKDKEWVYIYYRGTNDAWDGYGGATVYATSPELNPEWIPDLEAASKKVGVKWSDFVITDNSCKPAPELTLQKPTDLDTLADDAKVLEKDFEKDIVLAEKTVADDVRKVGRYLDDELNTFTKKLSQLESGLVNSGPGRPAGFMTKEELKSAQSAKDRRQLERFSKRLGKIQDTFRADEN